MTSPSTGTRSPGSTRTTSPARTVAVRTITSSAAGAAAAAPPPSAAALGRGMPQRVVIVTDDTDLKRGDYFDWAAGL